MVLGHVEGCPRQGGGGAYSDGDCWGKENGFWFGEMDDWGQGYLWVKGRGLLCVICSLDMLEQTWELSVLCSSLPYSWSWPLAPDLSLVLASGSFICSSKAGPWTSAFEDSPPPLSTTTDGNDAARDHGFRLFPHNGHDLHELPEMLLSFT